MYLPTKASRVRQREAERARANRREIVKALSQGQVSRRDLFRWGILTTGGLLVEKQGLSPFARSAYAQGITGIPRSPLFGAAKFTQPMPRLDLLKPQPLTRTRLDGDRKNDVATWPSSLPELPAKRLSYHTDFSSNHGPGREWLINPRSGRGPIEGRPPGEWFAHQRWHELFPKVGYVLSMGQIAQGLGFHPRFPAQNPNSVWSFGRGRFAQGALPPLLIKGRYGEPIITRIYNNLPLERAQNGGFGRNEIATHFHNAHNGAESDGASNAFHFPGTFYDYLWSTTLARRDRINKLATDRRASAPNGRGGLNLVPGDFRELQGTMWFHDHRFFFTAENVYKGSFGAVNYYSGPDRGNEELEDGVNLRLPSGRLLDWGNLDFDVNLVISDLATDPDGQLTFDIFNTDGFIADLVAVNLAYAPYFEVLPRKYRFRILNASMARYIKLVLIDAGARPVPFQFVANDGNLVTSPITLAELDQQGPAERYDIVVDFSRFRVGQSVRLVNLQRQQEGTGPDNVMTIEKALKGVDEDPTVGPIMEFRVVGQVQSVDVPGVTLRSTDLDRSRVPIRLTEQIPIVAPVRTRVLEFGKSGDGTSRGPTGECTPDCREGTPFPWSVSVNGGRAHTFNANRISLLIPKPGEVEHWTFVNSGGGWDHPIHLHFEEGVTIDRGGASIPATELLVRKDVWRLRESGRVKVQVQFGEFGGSYVSHCHNTSHEDFAMLLRYQLISDRPGEWTAQITPTPNPTPDGVTYSTPEILREGDPRRGGGA
jgi:FtsP/CotA-like multicopper oxidase with cupredoxin domain